MARERRRAMLVQFAQLTDDQYLNAVLTPLQHILKGQRLLAQNYVYTLRSI